MARKLFNPCDSSARKSTTRHKEFTKPLFDADAMRVIGRAYDKGVIKEVTDGKVHV